MWFAQSRVWPNASNRGGTASRPALRTDATSASFDAQQIENEIRDLQAALERGRGKLAPETVQVLEENLRTIHKALQDARTALAQDPANSELKNYLAGAVQRKLDFVRRAATLAGV